MHSHYCSRRPAGHRRRAQKRAACANWLVTVVVVVVVVVVAADGEGAFDVGQEARVERNAVGAGRRSLWGYVS